MQWSLLLPFLWIAAVSFIVYHVWSFINDIRLGAIVIFEFYGDEDDE